MAGINILDSYYEDIYIQTVTATQNNPASWYKQNKAMNEVEREKIERENKVQEKKKSKNTKRGKK